MFRNRGIAFKLVFLISLVGCSVFVAIVGYNYYISRGIIERNVQENVKLLGLSTTNRIDAVLQAVEKIPENLAYSMESSNLGESELFQLLYDVVTKNPEIYGIGIAFEPRAFLKDRDDFAVYFYRPGNYIGIKYLDKHYNYFMWDWYQIPRETNGAAWIEPYFGEAGEIIMVSYSVPFYKKVDGERRFVGVITVDLSLERLTEIMSSVKVLKTGYGFLVSQNGTFVAHPVKKLIMNETIFSVAEALNDPSLRELGRDMIHGRSGFVPVENIGVRKGRFWMYFTPIPSNGWSLGIIFPAEELAADVLGLNNVVIALGIVGVALLSLMTLVIARSMTSPLRAIAKATSGIAEGNLDIALPPAKSADEVGRLTESFGHMQSSLKDHIKKLTAATAERERMESELRIASEIQMSILPRSSLTLAGTEAFELHALIRPAREVGGDFYDYFNLEDGRVCFVMADVSGKGIPAALFMAVTKTLIKGRAITSGKPARILQSVNDEVAAENDQNMFVTVFCGIMDLQSGRVVYSNGGHNPPVLLKRGGEAAYVREPVSLLVGIIADTPYAEGEITLGPGDCLFLYTDGVVEAQNTAGEFFGDDRLLALLQRAPEQDPEGLSNLVLSEVRAFSGEAEQSDDITMMAIRWKGR
jgi:phosphoserine phosphatase RsbU/P